MARFIVETDAHTVTDLQAFDVDGYRYSNAHSTPDAPCFIRDPEVR